MKKFIFVSLFSVFASLGFASISDACPQAIRRERVRVVQPRQRVERQVVHERVVHAPVRERIVERQYYSAPVVRERVILEQNDYGCAAELNSGCVQEFRRVERVRSGY